MNKALFMTRGGQNSIDNAYEGRVQREIAEELGLAPAAFALEDLEKHKEEYGQVTYIFSTWGMLELTKEQIQRYFPALRAVFYAAGTVQYFARPFLELGIGVHSAWVANGVPVAEFAFSQIVLAGKGFFQGARLFKEQGFASSAEFSEHFSGNYGIQIGLLGAGVIGRMLIERLKSIKASVLVFDPFLSEDEAQALGVQKAGLEHIFANCHIVSNHLANNAQTKEMLQYRHFSMMRPYATFINTGRGGQLAEGDFIRALQERPDITALLDVTDPNEPLPAGHPFLAMDNVVLSPHIAGSKGQEILRMGQFMHEEYLAIKAGQAPKYAVSLEMLKTMA